MDRLEQMDIDSFYCIMGVIRSNHSHYWELLSENIQLMYKMLIKKGYTRKGAIDSIYSNLIKFIIPKPDEKPNPYIQPFIITPEYIEMVTMEKKKEVK